jgi:hypothetical protein
MWLSEANFCLKILYIFFFNTFRIVSFASLRLASSAKIKMDNLLVN